jgi:hypothetical protein
MHDPLGNDVTLLWLEIERFVFKVDDEMPFENEEKLIIVVMLVPVIFTLHNAESND